MNRLPTTVRTLCAAAALLAGGAAVHATTVSWADWTTFGNTTASGTMAGFGVTVAASQAMNGVSHIGGAGNCPTNYWTEPNALDPAYTGGSVSNAPTACEQLGLNTANSVTVTFTSAVSSLYMALLSVGQPSVPVTYDFNQAFTIDSEGAGYWGNDATDGVVGAGDTLTMREFHGVLLFNAPVTSLTFSTAPGENWHAFTFGAAAPAAVPEPASLLLAGGALLAAAAASRRRG